jgi:formyl-CoA transferase
MLLGDMGAEIIKIEHPAGGDTTRQSLGFRMNGEDTAAFLAVNRNKKSVTIDLKSDAGSELFREFVKSADVVVENFRPGVTERLGIDYRSLSEINPKLIYGSISGFGRSGPYAMRAGYDLTIQAMAGVMSVTGEPGGDPVRCGLSVSDLGAGLFCTYGILSALLARTTTGEGQHVATSLFEAALALSIWETAEVWATGRTPQPFGSAHRLTAPYQAIRTKDGHITIAANTQRLWVQLCAVIRREDLIEDGRFTTNENRMVNRHELETELERVLLTRTTEEWVQLFEEVGFPAGPIRNYQQVLEDPHTLERRMIETYEHPVEGMVKTLGIAVKLSSTPGAIRLPAPLLGEHTVELLRDIGISSERVEQLRAAGVI